MEIFKILIQSIIAISIYNVWLFRVGKPTTFRGGSAQNMKEEFESYGLSETIMKLVGFLKLFLATILISPVIINDPYGSYISQYIEPAAIGMATLMLIAIIMHIKVKDKMIKSFPAFSFLVLSILLLVL